jgi:hypothetical protein
VSEKYGRTELIRPVVFVFISELGQSRHFDRGPAPSGMTRSTDIVRPPRHVGLVPVAAIEDDGTILYSILTRSLPYASPKVYPG